MRACNFSTNLLLAIMCTSFISCSSKQDVKRQISTIDRTLQIKATSILENKLSKINASSGQIIIMEVQSGQIKALVGLERKDSRNYQSCSNFATQSPTGLMHPISLLAALETGKVSLSDKVDVGNGIYLVNGEKLIDHNWQRGGYGKITVEQGLACGSNIATYKTTEKAFGDNPQAYFDILAKMSYGKPDSVAGIDNLKPASFVTPKDRNWSNTSFAWFCIGYKQLISPIQTLTFYNAIANNGKMVKPQLYKDSTVIINPQIASKETIQNIHHGLERVITEGLGKPASIEKISIAGKTGIISLNDKEEIFRLEFCGYFPARNPQYTAIVIINKKGLPASSGLMAGDAFKQVVEYLMKK
jgi:Cell division protein FtsI/penicillin-binding protein 2|nr:penicillin-binding transpeptidase domain-containing protein [uncultured Bacteroides sp.]